MTTISFKTIRDFQEYFLHCNQLYCHKIMIQDAHPLALIERSILEVMIPLKQKHNWKLLLNKLLAPIGKVLEISFPNPIQVCTYDLKECLEVSCPEGVLLTAFVAETVWIRASELFMLMAASSRWQLKLQNEQLLCFIGLKAELLAIDKERPYSDLKENVLKPILGAGLPFGFRSSLDMNNVQLLRGKRSFPLVGEQYYLAIKGEIHLCLHENNERWHYDESSFIKRMLLQPLKIPPHQPLRIQGELIGHFAKVWVRLLKDKNIFNNFATFIMGQLFLPFGKNILFSANPKIELHDDTLTFSYPEECSCTLIDEGNLPLFIDVALLGEQLLRYKRRGITIKPKQELIFYGLTAQEKERLYKPQENLLEIVDSLLLSRLPQGLAWSFLYKECKIKVARFKDIGAPIDDIWMIVSSATTEMHLTLERPTKGEIFALSIAQNSPPALQNDLAEATVEAIFFLLFKSIFYFFSAHFQEWHQNQTLPPFFKPQTTEAIRDLLNNDAFIQHLENVLDDDTSYERIHAMHQATPEEFDQLAKLKDDDSKSLKEVVLQIRGLASQEIQGRSSYVEESIKFVSQHYAQQKEEEEKALAKQEASSGPANLDC